MKLKGMTLTTLPLHAGGSGQSRPPTFHGPPYVLLADKPDTKVDEAHGWEPHYELYAWVFRPNPNGMYAEFSPLVTCKYNTTRAAQMSH